MSTLQTASEITELIDNECEKSISLVLPTHQAGRKVQQNAIRFKNLVSQATAQLVAQGEAESEAEKYVQPLRDLQGDDSFWQHQQAGLAVYFADGQVTTIGLHASPPEVVVVAGSFFVVPVALDAAGRRRFRVLALTWDEARLFTASRSGVEVEQADSFPVSLRDVILPPDAEEHLQFRSQSTSTGQAMFHGQGEGEGVIESDRKRFFSEVGKRLEDLNGTVQLPLIFAGTVEVRGEFTANSRIEIKQSVEASPDGLTDEEFSERVLQLVVNSQDSSAQYREQLGNALANRTGSRDAPEIVAAATSGRVEKLFVNTSIFEQRGSFDAPVRDEVNAAVIATLRTGGEVTGCENEVVESKPLAAIFRY